MKYTDIEPKWELIPEGMRDGVARYIVHGTRPGHFLSAVICNDLTEAVNRADMTNRKRIADYVAFFYNYTPLGCWGSPEKFEAWVKHKGLEGSVLQSKTNA